MLVFPTDRGVFQPCSFVRSFFKDTHGGMAERQRTLLALSMSVYIGGGRYIKLINAGANITYQEEKSSLKKQGAYVWF